MNASTPTDLAALPKAEVHVHLEGAIRPATLEEFCARAGVSVPARSFTNLNGFIDAMRLAGLAITSPDDYARIVREYCEDAACAGVRYAELEVATVPRPSEYFYAALEEASKQRDVVIRFVVGLPRSRPVEMAWAALEAASAPEVVAVGLAGPEDRFPPDPFAEVFAEAKRRGLRSAPHAGEAAGPESVHSVLDALGAERIQHGVRSVEDPALVAELAERRIPLAVCPTSNVLLGVAPSLEEHPLRQLWDAGVLVSVNTDDPGFFDCDLTGEYAIAGRLLGLDRAGYGQLAKNSVESTFAPDEIKEELRTAIDDWVARGAA